MSKGSNPRKYNKDSDRKYRNSKYWDKHKIILLRKPIYGYIEIL